MAERPSINGLKDILSSATTMTDGELQGHLNDIGQRVEELDYSPVRQQEARQLLGYVSFELTARAVDGLEGLSREGRHKYIATVLGNIVTDGFEIDTEQFETVPSR